eukprot:jgi/Tetstr1/427071/TSEL_017276.t1
MWALDLTTARVTGPQEDMDTMVSSSIHLANKDYTTLADGFIGLKIMPGDCDRAKVIPLMDKALSPYIKGDAAPGPTTHMAAAERPPIVPPPLEFSPDNAVMWPVGGGAKQYEEELKTLAQGRYYYSIAQSAISA